jgi:redox-sensitive bicupin YhaK (pirin superfamily)
VITVRPLDSLHHTEGGWFSANWHFSFDDYIDPANMQFGDLRVFNDDRLIPGAIWPMHPHRDVEGITYVAEGTFKHADSMGHGGVLLPGSIQRVTLGSGMQHSEQNGSTEEPMRFIQLWILPAERGLPPSVSQHEIDPAEWRRRRNALVPVIVPAPGFGHTDAPKADGQVTVHQDAAVHAGVLDEGADAAHRFRSGFGGYAFVVHGAIELRSDGESELLKQGEAAKIRDEPEVTFVGAGSPGELILVETRLGRS